VTGRILGSYKIAEKIGEGGMGAVYRADHQRLARRAAIKVLRPELSTNAMVVERFFTEARATSLIRHPGIVEVTDCSVEDGCAYIVMELLAGESLASYLRRNGPLRERGFLMAVRIAEEIASAVGAAHAQQIIHRDLKPDNVFLVSQAGGAVQVKILDFGIAKLVADDSVHRTSTGSLLGTPIYMSPEQCRGTGKVDIRTDIYSLGCIIYELVSGRPPFMRDGAGELIAAHIGEMPVPLEQAAPEVPAALAALAARMLAKNPADRPASMSEVLFQLQAVHGAGPRTTVLVLPSTPSRPVPEVAAATPALPATAVLLPKTAVLTPADPPRPYRTTLGESAHSEEPPATAPAPSRRWIWAVAAAVVVVAGGVLGVSQWRRPALTVTTSVGPPPVAVAIQPPPAPPPAPPPVEWVVVDVENSPPGTTAVVDGERKSIPLRLEKGSPAREVRFEASGYQPRTVAVDGDRDRLLVLEWKRVEPPAPPRHRPAKAERKEPRPAPTPAVSKKRLEPIEEL
jgi:serine/threonine-protein kinase